MAVQFDFRPGFDLSPLATATFAQLIQAIAQIEPLTNIGGVVFQAGTTSDASIPQGTLGSPSVTDNSRFARYWWINTRVMPAVPYLYNSSTLAWVSTTVAAASIGPTQLAAHATVLDHFFNATVAVAGEALKLLRYDSAGDLIEGVSLATILVSNSVPLTAINKVGATDLQVLQYKSSDGLVLFRDLTAASFANNSIGLAKLAVATAGYLMQMNSGGTAWEGVLVKTALDGKGLYLSSLGNNNSVGGVATPLQVVQRNAADTANEWTTPIFSKASGAKNGAIPASAGLVTIAHGLGVIPTLWKAFIVMGAATELGYSQGDEVPLDSCYASDGVAVAVIYVDATNVYLRFNDQASVVATLNKTTGAEAGITLANWTTRIYAWA